MIQRGHKNCEAGLFLYFLVLAPKMIIKILTHIREMMNIFQFKFDAWPLFIALFWIFAIPRAIPLKFSSNGLHQILQYSCLLLFVPVIILIARQVKRYMIAIQSPPSEFFGKWLMTGATLICGTVWSIYGVIFYPGIISWDFYAQWHEMSGNIPLSDWHPVFHTLFMRAVTRIWYSPAMVSLIQISTMSVLVGMAAVRLLRNGVPSRVIVTMVIFYAFFPLNGFYAVSLWKDIGYSIAFLWLNVLIVDVVFSSGRVLAQRSFQISIFLVLCCVAMMRHNGLVPAFGSLLMLLTIYHRTQLKPILILILSLAALILFFKGPFFTMLNVDVTDKNVLKAHLPIQHIGAVLNADGEIASDDRIFLSKIMPLSYWKEAYDPRSCMPLIFGKDQNGATFLKGEFLKKYENYQKFLVIWAKIALHNPYPIIQYYRHSTELLWRIHTWYNPFVIADEDLLESHLFTGYKPSQRLSEHAGPGGRFLIHLVNNHATGWLFHRGAFYFWVSLFFLSLTTLRANKATVMIIAAPMLLQALTVAAFPLVQDTRFMFPVILVSPLLIALFFSARLTDSIPNSD